jgi:hypothetical protein
MWPHFVHLFWRIVHGAPLLVSSNWAAWLIAIGVFAFSQLIVLVRSGWREMLKRWIENIGIGLISAAGAYVFLFGWGTIQTIYDDHRDSVGRWQAVVAEKNILQKELGKRDEYIKLLTNRTCSICPPHSPISGGLQPAQTHLPIVGGVRVASQKTVLSTNPKYPYALEVILQTDATIQPVAIGLDCDGRIGDASAGPINGGMIVQSKQGYQDNEQTKFVFEWNSPAFAPETPIRALLYSTSYIQVTDLRVLIYSWP